VAAQLFVVQIIVKCGPFGVVLCTYFEHLMVLYIIVWVLAGTLMLTMLQ
jgi:hypothetical protein